MVDGVYPFAQSINEAAPLAAAGRPAYRGAPGGEPGAIAVSN